MLCSKCKKSPASFFYTQNINGVQTSIALCEHCAANSTFSSIPVSPLFESFFSNSAKNSEHVNSNEKRCSLCALTFNDILASGKVGCPECYNVFSEELSNTITSIHGNASHHGLVPQYLAPNTESAKALSEKELLRNELNKAIQSENYEAAAIIRDKLKAMEGESDDK